MKVDAEAARRFLVTRQLLSPARSVGGGPEGVLAVVRRLGSLQFDPIAVAGRSHDLVLHARAAGYEPGWCDLLYERRDIFEAYNKGQAAGTLNRWEQASVRLLNEYRESLGLFPLEVDPRLVVAARAYGLRPIDGPFGDFSDPDGYKAQAYRAAVLGCEGKWAIHPSQVALANEVFSPSEAEVTKAKRIIEAMEQAKREGKGAVALDGKLIDIASIRQAEVLVRKAEQVKSA